MHRITAHQELTRAGFYCELEAFPKPNDEPRLMVMDRNNTKCIGLNVKDDIIADVDVDVILRFGIPK